MPSPTNDAQQPACDEHRLLIASVGGSPEPIIASIKHWRPDRVLFVVSPESAPEVEQRILPGLAREGIPLGHGQFDLHRVSDGQDLQSCVQDLRPLHDDIRRWQQRGSQFSIVVDYTGGTKNMSAALALSMHRAACRFSYVGGSQRTKNNIGVVVSGTEKILASHNPWETLGYQFIEDALVLFKQQAYASAVALLEQARDRLDASSSKTELNALATLLRAYATWDRFNHSAALHHIKQCQRYTHALEAVLGKEAFREVKRLLPQHQEFLQRLESTEPNLDLVHDLLANAQRRANESRFDDAVARLYRAIEALAQIRLRDRHGLRSDKVPIDRVPEKLQGEWRARAENGTVRLGLQDAYRLLAALDDEVATRFQRLGLDDRKRSPLVARNESILAHGFRPVGEDAYEQLWQSSLELAQIDDPQTQLPNFPRLA